MPSKDTVSHFNDCRKYHQSLERLLKSTASNLRTSLGLGAIALLLGALAWPLNGSIWSGDVPAALLSFVLALLSFIGFRSKPRVAVALAISLLGFAGAAMRQTYEQHKLQAECEDQNISDCGELLYGFPKVGWPVIIAPFLGFCFRRQSSGEMPGILRIASVITEKGLRELPKAKAAGFIAVLGLLGCNVNDDRDLPIAILSVPAVLISAFVLRRSPRLAISAILSLAAFAGLAARYTYERKDLLAYCRQRPSCLGIALSPVPNSGWPVVGAPFLALALVQMTRRWPSTLDM